MVRFRTVLAMLALVAAVGVAHGEDRGRARELFKSGSQHFKLGEYGEALTAFKEAYRNFEDPTILFNIAQCHRQLNQKPEAIRFYRTYLSELPKAPNRDEVRQLIAMLETALAQETAARTVPPSGTLGTPPRNDAEPRPEPSVTPATIESPRADVVRAAPTRTPVYKKWWFWTAVGGAVVVAVGVGVGVGLALSPGPSAPSVTPMDGVFRF
jgi:hypothetical protein